MDEVTFDMIFFCFRYVPDYIVDCLYRIGKAIYVVDPGDVPLNYFTTSRKLITCLLSIFLGSFML